MAHALPGGFTKHFLKAKLRNTLLERESSIATEHIVDFPETQARLMGHVAHINGSPAPCEMYEVHDWAMLIAARNVPPVTEVTAFRYIRPHHARIAQWWSLRMVLGHWWL
nr:hypothetical protein CFP56_09457 [Quercus suber]